MAKPMVNDAAAAAALQFQFVALSLSLSLSYPCPLPLFLSVFFNTFQSTRDCAQSGSTLNVLSRAFLKAMRKCCHLPLSLDNPWAMRHALSAAGVHFRLLFCICDQLWQLCQMVVTSHSAQQQRKWPSFCSMAGNLPTISCRRNPTLALKRV